MAVHIGTSGFSYQHWRGVFYPPGVAQTKWLEYYAERFPTVELNVTFYRLPSEKAVLSWQRRAPAGFIYAAKLSRLITHLRRLRDADDELELFLSRIKLLGEHLGPILIQLPPNMKAGPELLDAFLAKCDPALRWAVEFRDHTWFTDATYAVLHRRGAALCIHDYLPDHPLQVTAPFVYLRFHGTDHLYTGDYPDNVLRQWADRLQDWSAHGLDGYAYFNNDVGGYAVKNARTLMEMFSAQP
ncbi:MAG: DUF72 domain-containing protein [Armatimonadota bacterium]